MSRPEIVALIAAGHTDTGIAARLGIDRATANKARHELRWRATRTAAHEAVPTGQVFKRRPWTAEEQAAHRAELLAALNSATDHRPTRRAAAAYDRPAADETAA